VGGCLSVTAFLLALLFSTIIRFISSCVNIFYMFDVIHFILDLLLSIQNANNILTSRCPSPPPHNQNIFLCSAQKSFIIPNIDFDSCIVHYSSLYLQYSDIFNISYQFVEYFTALSVFQTVRGGLISLWLYKENKLRD
jgi:hypothetical protein